MPLPLLPPAKASACATCGAPLYPSDLACPTCQHLVYSGRLGELANQARAAEASNDLAGALVAWRTALPLLPHDSVQRQSIEGKVNELAGQFEVSTPLRSGAGETSSWRKRTAGLGPVAYAVWKFKTAALLVLTKGKLILLGLTKASTFFSMFASIGVYWALFGWPFAVGSVISIYIHEMGHVIALRSRGIPAGAPMFIPGFGAIIQMRGLTITAIEDARIGLAGPLYGSGAALAALLIYWMTGAPIWSAIAHFGALINIFNLVPIWQLDGSRGFHSLNTFQRQTIAATAFVLWIATSQVMLLAVAAVGVYRLFTKDAAVSPDNVAWIQFAGLLAGLSAILVLSAR